MHGSLLRNTVRFPANAILILTALAVILGGATTASAQDPVDKWAPFRPLIGKWHGTGQGPAGAAEQVSEWKLVLGDQFIQATAKSTAAGENHEDLGMISFDEARKKYVYRAFHSEGFVNEYVADISQERNKIVFLSESIENGPPGLRAMVVIDIRDGELRTALSLAQGAGEFVECASATLTRNEQDKEESCR